MSLLISANRLTHSYGGRTLFSDLSCGIFENDKVGLIGPNGAGKSTLFKILSQMIKPDSGDVVHRKGLKVGFLQQTVEMDDSKSWFHHLIEIEPDYAELLQTLSKLELTNLNEDLKFSECSGGLQKRIGIAAEMLKKPDVLFLDEPTNHLDVDSIIWIEDFLKDSQLSYVLITHDRLFLERTCTKIFDLDKKNPKFLLVTEGDLAVHLEKKEQLITQQRSTIEKMKNTLTRETEWLRRGAIARQTKQKFRIQNHAVIKGEFEDLKMKVRSKSFEFDFGEKRTPKKLLEIKDLDFSYGDRRIFENFNMLVMGTTRLGILGRNGSGKSTLLKLILNELAPDKGTVQLTDGVKVSYFEQTKQTLNLSESVLKNICPQGDYVKYQGEHVYAKTYLERFGFNYDQMELPVAKLSGGEKSRIRIAQLMLEESQLLLLDEPTNDLDFESLTSLQKALADFPGGIILVSHDRYFMDTTCNQIMYVNPPHPIELFSDYFQWEEYFFRADILQEQEKIAAKNMKKQNTKKGLSFKEVREWEGIETEIQKLEAQLESLQKESQSEVVMADSKRTYEIFVEIQSMSEKINILYSRWQELDLKK
ncbi:MAG: ABC-F family ATP-binding cassette domain-containing protein [Bdellovibrionaceae bacterium]|nr:ABC-F family ATP-binding cassette domain-containing protein [Pseudobdellovibrionaceae bacterium]